MSKHVAVDVVVVAGKDYFGQNVAFIAIVL